ncbi:hypothetical protein [Effusibacillus consociatus]|uniref:Uncharacterized protein n=1 Tax=Effusibacillus consociatus TaxID=1117041 RepID=A0ABV9Q4L6_9BACL
MVRATELIREKLLRTIMLKWILDDVPTIKRLPMGEMWANGLFQPVADRITEELVQIKRQLHSNAVFIMEEEWSSLDVRIQYKEKNIIKHAIYPIPMLEAEAQGRLEHLKTPSA